ncbi:Glycerol-3-phosphate dehydrogenase [NAD(P)+] [Bienertia sinuspersici]
MIKSKILQSMAISISKEFNGMFKNDTISSFARKISTYNHCHSSRFNVANIGFSLKNCADFHEKVPNLKNEDVNGFYKTRAFTLSHQPLSEVELQLQEEKRGSGILDVNNGGVCQRGGSTGFFDGCSLPEKIVVAVDVDEVLGNFVSALNRFIADRYASNHSVSEYHVYEFFKIWKCSRDEADIRVHEFFKTPYFKNGIYPIPGAQKTLNKLSNFCNLSVVTYVFAVTA